MGFFTVSVPMAAAYSVTAEKPASCYIIHHPDDIKIAESFREILTNVKGLQLQINLQGETYGVKVSEEMIRQAKQASFVILIITRALIDDHILGQLDHHKKIYEMLNGQRFIPVLVSNDNDRKVHLFRCGPEIRNIDRLQLLRFMLRQDMLTSPSTISCPEIAFLKDCNMPSVRSESMFSPTRGSFGSFGSEGAKYLREAVLSVLASRPRPQVQDNHD